MKLVVLAHLSDMNLVVKRCRVQAYRVTYLLA